MTGRIAAGTPVGFVDVLARVGNVPIAAFADHWRRMATAMRPYAGIEYDLRREYNGRGMGDATCVGIVVASHSLTTAIAVAGEVDGALKAGLNTDNMGRRVIMYWPSISL